MACRHMDDGLASSMEWTDDFHLTSTRSRIIGLRGMQSIDVGHRFQSTEGCGKSGSSTAKTMSAPRDGNSYGHNPWDIYGPRVGTGVGDLCDRGVWIALQMWDHYRFTKDVTFRGAPLPVFKDAARSSLLMVNIQHTDGCDRRQILPKTPSSRREGGVQ